MRTPKPVFVDFETEGIDGRPDYPPKPVGVSIKYPGKAARYYAWGHPTKNNCSLGEALIALRVAWKWECLCFQNGKFDIDVASAHLNLPVPGWERIHDTLFLIFLEDPREAELSLKPAATRLLGMAPEEQDAVGDWLVKHQPVPNVKISRSKGSKHYFGRYICLAPGDLVGKYANGDVVRTEKLFNLLWPRIVSRGMLAAYDRERQLMPTLLDMEREGLPIDVKRLKRDVAQYEGSLETLNAWLVKKLKAPSDINLDSGEQLVQAMVDAGVADADLIPRTLRGKFQHSKEVLLGAVTDKPVLGVLKYRTQLSTCMNTFMKPWLATALRSEGLIYTTWNQTRTPSGDHTVGTRTGRLSATPNFQNIPNVFIPIFKHESPKTKGLPTCPFPKLPPLPKVRSYITPFEGQIMVDRDYSQQEPRILAHFDGGGLLQRYLDDPWIDFHDYAKAELAKMGKHYERKPVKNTNLGLIYGMGVGKLAAKNDMSVEEAAELKKAILTLYPGLRDMYRDMKLRAKNKEPIRTWGGREYYCEEPKLVEGRIRQFDYKLVNILIQGSAADCTKEAIIRWDQQRDKDWRLLLNVHDQLTASAPKKQWKDAMACMKKAMESVEFDVPLLTEGTYSATNWAELRPYDKKGQVV
jgi:DNA polymerase I